MIYQDVSKKKFIRKSEKFYSVEFVPEPLSESYIEGRCLDDKYLIYKNSSNFETE